MSSSVAAHITPTTTAAAADPRRADRIVEYKPEVKRIEDDDPDVAGFVALVLAAVGLMISNRNCLWVGFVFAVESYLNQRSSESALMGTPTSMVLFSLSTLGVNYLPQIMANFK
ncbi:hypothetical protein BGX29_007592 [Mortierella sp. GBA35]|nr:hypothetical protein BGX23_003563 [Mortierella sp. AD031]KAF9098483.1 hypothetical protein BGX29_007592 [Mortierella sp. GBA35]KAG0200237.1 hypothetical protein BGX33_011138 [Mortierella sp. NVP41]